MYEQVEHRKINSGFISDSSIDRDRLLPPGPQKNSWDNMAFFIKESPHEYLANLSSEYGNISRIPLNDGNLVVLSGFDAITDILNKQGDKLSARAEFDILKQAPQRHFVELKSGKTWEKHRGIISQAMHDFFANRWSEVASWLAEEAADLNSQLAASNGQPFNPNRGISLANFSFIQRIIFGRRCDDADRSRFREDGLKLLPNGFMNSVRYDIAPPMLRPLIYFLRRRALHNFRQGLAELSGYIGANVQQHRETFDAQNPRDITDLLLQASDGLTADEKTAFRLAEMDIVNGTLTQFAGAGTGVATFAIRWALYYMINYPHIQAQVQAELDQVVGRDALPAHADRGKLPFTMACINEILRHSALTPMAAVYYATTSDISIHNYYIPKKTPVLVDYYSVTRDPSVWEKAEAFNPSRFIGAYGELRKDLTTKFFPFGLGPRRCLGEHLGRLQIFLLFTNLLHRFSFAKVPGDNARVKSIPGVFTVPDDFQLVACQR